MSEKVNESEVPADETHEAQDSVLRKRKEGYTSWQFHTQLETGIKKLRNPQFSMGKFNVFCCQNYPPLAALGLSERAGFLSIKDVARCFNVEYKTIYRMIENLEIAAGKVAGRWRIPGSAVVLHFNVGVWHNREDDQQTRLRAMHKGNLSVLEVYDSSGSIPNMWNAYVKEELGETPAGCSWSDLVQKSKANQ